jgi:hypothetical protein
LFQGARHVHEILVREEQLAERIATVGIKTGRDNDQVRAEVR